MKEIFDIIMLGAIVIVTCCLTLIMIVATIWLAAFCVDFIRFDLSLRKESKNKK